MIEYLQTSFSTSLLSMFNMKSCIVAISLKTDVLELFHRFLFGFIMRKWKQLTNSKSTELVFYLTMKWHLSTWEKKSWNVNEGCECASQLRLKRFIQKLSQFSFFAVFGRIMSCRGWREYRRKGMAVSVTILGLALLTVFLAYIAFGDANERSDPLTVRYVAIVCIKSNVPSQWAMNANSISIDPTTRRPLADGRLSHWSAQRL